MAMRNRSATWSAVDGLAPQHARILEAYYALRNGLPADAVGSVEIIGWLREQYSHEERPSHSLVRTVLARAGVPRRGDGRPRSDSRPRDDASPFLPVRREAPRLRDSRRR